MSRAERLLDLIQVLRRHRRPVSGQTLADELGVSLRTVYRDIQTLIGQGAAIDGEAGIGFVLRPGFVLPPLMFTDEEIEALVLGLRFVARQTDAPLERAAADALAKIAAVLPDDLRDRIADVGLIAAPVAVAEAIDLAPLRAAIRSEHKVVLDYADKQGRAHAADHLADRDRLLRAHARDRGVVRDARRLSPFPHRSHRGAAADRPALSATAPRADAAMARERGHFRADLMLTETVSRVF